MFWNNTDKSKPEYLKWGFDDEVLLTLINKCVDVEYFAEFFFYCPECNDNFTIIYNVYNAVLWTGNYSCKCNKLLYPSYYRDIVGIPVENSQVKVLKQGMWHKIK